MANLDGIDDGELLSAVLAWSDSEPEFDPDFVNSLDTYYERNNELTEKQRRSLCSIIEKWKISLA